MVLLLIFLDLCFNEEELVELNKLENKIIFIDHHQDSKEVNLGETHLDLTETKCAADMSYEIFEVDNPLIKQWVELAHDRDLWINKYKKATRKVDFVVKSNPNRAFDIANDCIKRKKGVKTFINATMNIWEYRMNLFNRSLSKANASALVTTITFNNKEYPIKMAWVDGYGSDVAEEIQEGNQIICLFKTFDTDIAIMLRTDRDDISLAELAKVFSPNGGGHHKSAGSSIKFDEFYKFMVNKISHPDLK